MKQSIQLLLFAAMLLLAASCRKVNADGPTVTEQRHHTGFTSIASSVNATMIVTQSPQYRVEIHAQQALLDRMKTKVEGGELRFYYPGDVHIGRHDGVTIYVSAPELDGLEINGSGELRCSELRATDQKVRLKINGSGNMYLGNIAASAVEGKVVGSGNMRIGGGDAVRASCEISGSGDIDFGSVDAQDVDARISGSGSIRTTAHNTLDVHISGSGKVYYRGAPRITTSISGSGKLQPY